MLTLRSELAEWRLYGAEVALAYRLDNEVREVSYRELVNDIFALERKLRLDPEQRVAIIGENSVLWFCYFYACLLAGKQTLICDMLLPINEMATVLQSMGIEKVYLSPSLQGLDAEIEENVSTCRTAFFEDGFQENSGSDADTGVAQDSTTEEGEILCLTSGTTGKAKGVMIGMPAFVNNNVCLSGSICGGKGDVVYSPLPMHHMYGVNKTFAFLHLGARICLGSMRSVEKDIQVFGPNRLLIVPTVVEFLDKRNRLDCGIESIIVSGCKCEKKVESICERHGIFLQNIYGSSESAGGMALNVKGDAIDELTVIPGRDIRIADDGEILVETKWLMDGYYQDKSATERKMSGNVLYTEDMGYFDDEGRLHINGRKKDMIAMENGDKIYCEETDEILSSLAGVKEAAVIYVKQKLIAVVCAQAGATEEQIRESIAQYNHGQQVIRRISDVWIRKNSLPRTVTGKMKRAELTEAYCRKFDV